jgi:hypothetical protein
MLESITILRPGEPTGDVDAQGNPVLGSETQITSSGWAVAPIVPDEDSLATGQAVVSGFQLFRRDQWVDVRATDRVRVRGAVYAVTTAAAKWQSPYSARVGTVVTVRAVG